MKVISKRISRNEFVSRKNGVIPSLVDMWIIPDTMLNCGGKSGSYVFGTYLSAVAKMKELGLSSSLLEYKAEYVYQDHNYGLVVSDVIIPDSIASKVTDYTDIYVNIPDGNGGYYDLNDKLSCVRYKGRNIISGGTFVDKDGEELCECFSEDCDESKLKRAVEITGGTPVKILTYTTLNKWYSFFNEYKRTIKMYDNAIGLYEAEFEPKNEVNQKRFFDLDALFNARGGDTMYNWIIENCMPHENDYDDDDTNDLQVKESFSSATNSASYVIPVLLTNSIDDLGEMTIFSTKWKDGVDYHNRAEEIGKCDRSVKDKYSPKLKGFVDCSGNADDQCFGTVIDTPYYINDEDGNIIYDYETYLIKGSADKKGYEQNQYYENEFKEGDYTNYTDWSICNNPDRFSSFKGSECVTSYTFSPIDGSVIYNPTDESAKEVIKYEKEDFVNINGEYVKVIDGWYVVPTYMSKRKSKKLPVYVDGSLKYAELNGVRFYALKDGTEEKIYFTKKSDCYGDGSPIIKAKYILYNGELFVVNGSAVEFDVYEDNKTVNQVLNGYFKYNGSTFYIYGDDILVPEVSKLISDGDLDIETITYRKISEEDMAVMGWESLSVDKNKGEVTIYHELDIKVANLITGYTDSKLDLLRRRKINVDELGIELPGYFNTEIESNFTGYNISVYSEYDECEPTSSRTVQFVLSDGLKVSGETYNTPYNQCTLDLLYKVGEVTDIEPISDGLYSGNYLESIEIYQLENGEKINSTFVEGDDSREVLKKYFDGDYYDPDKLVYCDITYYIGATLEYDEADFSYKPAKDKHKGVKYVDTLTVTKSVGDFHMNDGSIFTFIYYELKGDMSGEHLDDFNDDKLTNMAYFEMQIMSCYSNKEKEFDEKYWERNNGMVDAPVFRTEYNLWCLTPQKVKSNIYIDRGINAAFEKHFKIGEVHTMEALENYGNNYFKINED